MNLFLLGFDLAEEIRLGLSHLGFPGGKTDLLGVPPLLGHGLLSGRLQGGVGSDGSVTLLVHALQGVGSNTKLDKP